MERNRKAERYHRIIIQIEELIRKSNNPYSNMATIVALLHNKIDYFYWTGFYMLSEGKLQVATYQGTLACIDLPENIGVCWKGINTQKTVIVDDVHDFEGHIACDKHTNSEIVVPVFDKFGKIVGVLDVDSREKAAFDKIDAEFLEKAAKLVFNK